MAFPKSVLVIGAHIGDADVMAGALAAHLVRADTKVTFIHATDGEKGKPGVDPNVYRQQKVLEAKKSAAVLGVDVKFLGYEDGSLVASYEASKQLAYIIRELKPDWVITHWLGSVHQDHAATHYLTMNAVQYAGSGELKGEPLMVSDVYFAENLEDPYFFNPSFFVDVSDSYKTYVEALKVHEYVTQGAYGINFFDYYTSLLASRGASVGVKFAVGLATKPKTEMLKPRIFKPHVARARLGIDYYPLKVEHANKI